VIRAKVSQPTRGRRRYLVPDWASVPRGRALSEFRVGYSGSAISTIAAVDASAVTDGRSGPFIPSRSATCACAVSPGVNGSSKGVSPGAISEPVAGLSRKSGSRQSDEVLFANAAPVIEVPPGTRTEFPKDAVRVLASLLGPAFVE